MAHKITDACVSCGSCAENCPVEAISQGDTQYVIDADACGEWGAGAPNAPTEAMVAYKTDTSVKKCGAGGSAPCTACFPPRAENPFHDNTSYPSSSSKNPCSFSSSSTRRRASSSGQTRVWRWTPSVSRDRGWAAPARWMNWRTS